MDENKSNDFINRVVDKRELMLYSDKLLEIEVSNFEFVEKICAFFRVHMGFSESDFSRLILNATKDYYAYLKNTKKDISDDKLENALVNLDSYLNKLGNQTEFSNNEVVRKKAVKQVPQVKAFIGKIEDHFKSKMANKLNEDFVEAVEQYRYLYA